jgi:uncharacterized membrane protein
MTGSESRIFGLSQPWAKRVLLISLALNFLAIGLVSGVAMKTKEHRGGTTSFMTRSILEIGSDEMRSDIHSKLAARQDHISARRQATNASWQEMVTHLRQQPFDPSATRDVFAEMRRMRDDARGQAYEVIAEAVAQMSDAERTALADRMDEFLLERSRKR